MGYTFWHKLVLTLLMANALYIVVLSLDFLKTQRGGKAVKVKKRKRNILIGASLIFLLMAFWYTSEYFRIESRKEKTEIYLQTMDANLRLSILEGESDIKDELKGEKVDTGVRSQATLLFIAGARDLMKNDYQTALDKLNTSLEWVETGVAHTWRGTCYMVIQPPKQGEALKDFEAALRCGYEKAMVYNSLGVLYRKYGRIKAAKVAYSKAIELEPNKTIYHSNLGNLLLTNFRDDSGALEQYKEVTKLSPKNSGAHFNVGRAFLNLKQCDSAITRFQEAERLGFKTGGLHAAWGAALNRKGDVKSSLEHFKEAFIIDPDNYLTHEYYSEFLWNTGKLDSAITHIMTALKAEPDNPMLINNLALCYDHNGDTTNAKILYEKALTNNPEYLPIYINYSNLLGKMNHRKQALRVIATALQYDSTYAPALVTAGVLLMGEGKIDSAQVLLLKAKSIMPELIQAYSNLMEIYIKKEKLEDALSNFSDWQKIDTTNTDVMESMAKIYEKIGQGEQALKWWERAHKLEERPLFKKQCENHIAMLKKRLKRRA